MGWTQQPWKKFVRPRPICGMLRNRWPFPLTFDSQRRIDPPPEAPKNQMNSLLVVAQMANPEQGFLTRTLLGVTLSSAEWVLWLLCILSVMSIAVMLERALYFTS